MKLIIINGPPGAGKSSVSEALHGLFPTLTLLLKFDVQRRFLKNRHEDIEASNRLTFKMCLAMTEVCLQENKDVIFERAIIENNVLDNFVALGKKYDAQIFEFILWADKETILYRNTTRPMPADAAPDTKRVTDETAEKFWNNINELKAQRPHAHVIDVKENTLEQVIGKIKTIIAI